MSDVERGAPHPVVPPRRRSRVRVGVLLTASVLALGALTAWLVVGLNPSMTAGAFSAWDPESVLDEDPLGTVSTSVVVDPADGTWDGAWSIRNEGRAPATVRVHDDEGPYEAVAFALFSPNPAGGGYDHTDPERTAEALTLAPGEEAGLLVSVGMGCASYQAGSGMGITTVDLDVTTLGLTRTVTVDGNMQVLVHTQTGHAEGPECEVGR